MNHQAVLCGLMLGRVEGVLLRGVCALPSEAIDTRDRDDSDLVVEVFNVCTAVWADAIVCAAVGEDLCEIGSLTVTVRPLAVEVLADPGAADIGVLWAGSLIDTVLPVEVLVVGDAAVVGVLWAGSLIDTVLPLEVGVLVRAGVGGPAYAIVGGSPGGVAGGDKGVYV